MREVNWIVHVGLCRCAVLVPTTCSICLAVRCTVAVWFDFQNVKYIKRSFARGIGGEGRAGQCTTKGVASLVVAIWWATSHKEIH